MAPLWVGWQPCFGDVWSPLIHEEFMVNLKNKGENAIGTPELGRMETRPTLNWAERELG